VAGWKLPTTPTEDSPTTHFLSQKRIWSGLRYCPISTKIGICRQILLKLSGIQFYGSPLTRSRVVARVQTDGKSVSISAQLVTDMSKMTLKEHNFSIFVTT
jgi:hypothetical protein